jgi:hypothetical protein
LNYKKYLLLRETIKPIGKLIKIIHKTIHPVILIKGSDKNEIFD